jgi:hypothetical protein
MSTEGSDCLDHDQEGNREDGLPRFPLTNLYTFSF